MLEVSIMHYGSSKKGPGVCGCGGNLIEDVNDLKGVCIHW